MVVVSRDIEVATRRLITEKSKEEAQTLQKLNFETTPVRRARALLYSLFEAA